MLQDAQGDDLGESDSILRITEAAFTDTGEPSGWDCALEELRLLFDSSQALLISQDYRDRRVRVLAASGLVPKGPPNRPSAAAVGTLSWLHGAPAAPAPGRLFDEGEFVPSRPWGIANRSTAPVPELRQGSGGPPGRALGVSLCRRGAEACLLVFGRGAGDAPYDEAEEALLSRLWPVLERVLGIWGSLESARRTSEAALAALDAMPFGVAMIDSDGAVLSANRAAEELISVGDGIRVGPEGLEAMRDGRHQALRDLLHDTPSIQAAVGGAVCAGPCAPENETRFCVPRRHSSQPLTVAVAPLAKSLPAFVDGAAAAIVYIGDPGVAVRPDVDGLRELYGLTPAEARLTARLGKGERLSVAAEALNISYETARTHLKRVLSKTGTGRQAELMRLLASSPGACRGSERP